MSEPTGVRLYNTLTGSVETFTPLVEGHAYTYHCGPTVYGFAHIGNLKKYINDDTLRRALRGEGLAVTSVINITDIGHLTSDADDGDDKMTLAIKREGLPLSMESLQTVARKYTDAFISDIQALNILLPEHMPSASEWVPAQIELIERLFARGLAYDTSQTVYFDVAQFPEYGKLGHIDLTGQQEGARIAVDATKRGPHDFALWKKNPEFGFDSPWGKGFPGWHIECSAMAMGLLGETIDIHTGGIDHIPVHHNNEIAQSEGATGKPFARYWMHSEFITIDETKISKSLGNSITLADVHTHGFHPLALRYWVLSGHYRTMMNFSWEALAGAHAALGKLHRAALALAATPSDIAATQFEVYEAMLRAAIRTDLNTASALAALWSALRDTALSDANKRRMIESADRYLGLGLSEALTGISPFGALALETLPPEVIGLVTARSEARAARDFAQSDQLRSAIEQRGYTVIDTPAGTQEVFIQIPE
jgi:cysteinyl-tRNA synthetase